MKKLRDKVIRKYTRAALRWGKAFKKRARRRFAASGLGSGFAGSGFRNQDSRLTA